MRSYRGGLAAASLLLGLSAVPAAPPDSPPATKTPPFGTTPAPATKPSAKPDAPAKGGPSLLSALNGRPDPKPVKVSPDLKRRAEALIAKNPGGEAALMAKAILSGSQLGPGEGWFSRPAQKSYDWKWLAKTLGVKADAKVERSAFRGAAGVFKAIDRTRDGVLSSDDFSDSPMGMPYRQQMMASALFRRADRNGDGQVTAEEWAGVFREGTGGKPLSQSATLDLLFPAPPPAPAGSPADDGPSPDTLLKGLFAQEIGSLEEGPAAGAAAPDFTLSTADGGKTVRLKDVLGRRPVVLVLGNFSCGPFRSWSEAIAEVYGRHQERATFLAVYVREAHPTDGWRMEQNDAVGVAYPQPTDHAGRRQVAARCQKVLRFPFPLLVDTIDDKVGRLYSGMPDRFYVIDTAGTVRYKSARGPFGFRPAEMEQALALTLLADGGSGGAGERRSRGGSERKTVGR